MGINYNSSYKHQEQESRRCKKNAHCECHGIINKYTDKRKCLCFCHSGGKVLWLIQQILYHVLIVVQQNGLLQIVSNEMIVTKLYDLFLEGMICNAILYRWSISKETDRKAYWQTISRYDREGNWGLYDLQGKWKNNITDRRYFLEQEKT